jgi:predicted 3-demethylubiquinone-9 3-methyltransferase (glyoxalase superfamily)
MVHQPSPSSGVIMIHQPRTCLWFNDDAEAAASHYADVFNARILQIARYHGAKAQEISGRPEGSVLTIDLDVQGHRIQLLNGGPAFQQTEAASIIVPCSDQAEIDRIWNALLAGGARPSQCGWITDGFGLSWQIVPKQMDEWLTRGTPEQTTRVMNAVFDMVKLDTDALQTAFDGAHVTA